MMEWGMVDDIDFNTSDVVLDVERGRLAESDAELTPAAALRNKTRAYDFVLPFRTPTWQPHIFIQSQFYAGDSGSVSHKNVDQTQASRRNATSTCERARWPLPRFIEYVDGAGYSASLNRDLRSLLNFPDTADFFQIRSAPVRLRRQLQDIGFLTPMEIAHALIRRRNVMSAAIALLVEEGYQPVEIERSRLIAAENGYIRQVDGDDWAVPEDRIQIVRQYLVLDLVATNGREHENAGDPRGMVLIPGFGPYFGILLTVLAGIAAAGFPVLWPGQLLLSDLGELAGKGFVLLR
jgi:hypothetical protein